MSFRSVVNGEVRFSISPHSPCPCGNPEAASRCCLKSDGFHKIPSSTSPPAPKTGLTLQSCYAKYLSDCDLESSREHYISESLLHHLNRTSDLRASGLPWISEAEMILAPSAFTSKVLCRRHNSALLKLDAIAVRLFQAFDDEGADRSGKQLLYLFSGHDLERWLLKILCGITVSNNVSVDRPTDLSIPDYWLNILFGKAGFPDGQGLYICKSKGHRFEGPRGLRLKTIVRSGRLSGMGLDLCGSELILSMSGFPSRVFDGREVAYRPLEFYTTGRNFEKSIMFSWDGPADLGTISVNITAS